MRYGLVSLAKVNKKQIFSLETRIIPRDCYQARALRALGLLLADGGKGEDFLTGQPYFFTETAVTPVWKVEKWFPRLKINRHAEG